MSWKCPHCGQAENADGSRVCQDCGQASFGTLVLESIQTGKRVGMTLDTSVGRTLLRCLAGDDAVYASDPQFTVSRDVTAGAWMIRHAADAKNPTYVDGNPLADAGAPLAEGTLVSIGPERMKLRVKIADAGPSAAPGASTPPAPPAEGSRP